MVDLALYWTKPSPMGSNVDSVVEASLEVIEAARGAGLPIFFSTWDFDPDVRLPRPPHPPTTLRGERAVVVQEDPRLASPKSGAMIYVRPLPHPSNASQ